MPMHSRQTLEAFIKMRKVSLLKIPAATKARLKSSRKILSARSFLEDIYFLRLSKVASMIALYSSADLEPTIGPATTLPFESTIYVVGIA